MSVDHMRKSIVSAVVVFVLVAVGRIGLCAEEVTTGGAADGERFKDRIWLWCHVAGAHDYARHYDYGFGKYEFKVSPQEAADLLGIENIFMVKYNSGHHRGPRPSDFSSYYDSQNFDRFKKVIWSIGGEGGTSSLSDRNKAIELTQLKTNVVGFVLDDFFIRKERALTPGQLSKLRERLAHAGPNQSRANIWAVVYDTDVTRSKFTSNAKFASRFVPWLEEVDGITLWFKKQESLTLENMDNTLTTLEGHLNSFPNRPKVMLGIYMWRYMEKTHANFFMDDMNNQLEFARRSLAARRIDGIIFLASCIADTNGPAAPGIIAAKNWIALNKETPLRPVVQR
jgi:hypothetical protein